MSVLTVAEIGLGKRRGRLTDTFQREYSRYFRVTMSAHSDDAYTAATASAGGVSIPAMWEAYPSDSGALVKEIAPNETNQPNKWIVEARYSTAATDSTQETLDPLDEPAQFTFDTERVQKGLQEDLDFLTIRNSAEDPYDPPPTEEDELLILQYSDNVEEFVGSDCLIYVGRCNESSMWGQMEKRILCCKFRGVRMFRNDQIYWQRSLEFKIQPEKAWIPNWTQLVLLDAGHRIIKADDGTALTRKLPAGATGETPRGPSPLDGDGGNLALGAAPVYNTFRVRETVDFSPLMLEAPPLT